MEGGCIVYVRLFAGRGGDMIFDGGMTLRVEDMDLVHHYEHEHEHELVEAFLSCTTFILCLLFCFCSVGRWHAG